jgi:hypothetical protein
VVNIILATNPSFTTSVTNSRTAAILALVGNPIVTLGVHRNHIHNCWKNPFDAHLRAEALKRGFGGISLGFCEDVTISANRIERNGTSHVIPTCGIYIRFAEKLRIHENHIVDNGPVIPLRDPALERGVRGGIVVLASSLGVEVIFGGGTPFDTGRHAARIHDNIVYQPAGQALRSFGLGAVSIVDNHFSSEIAGSDAIERLAGLVFVLTAGSAKLPTGLSLFNGNQSRLGERAVSFTSQLLWTTDDLGFDANQCVALTEGVVLTDTVSFFINTFLLGRTLRATDSRFIEPTGRRPQALKASLLSRTSLLNNTNDNHGDHCIFALNTAPGRPANVVGNQVVNAALCAGLNNSIAPVSGFAVTAVVRE